MGLIDLQTDLTSLKYGAKLPAVRHTLFGNPDDKTVKLLAL